jgi:hypothetical protein
MLIGWFNLIQKGYLHHDISIGNVVMVEDAGTLKALKRNLEKGGCNATGYHRGAPGPENRFRYLGE